MLSRLGGVSTQKCKNQDFMYFKRGCLITQFRWEVELRFFFPEAVYGYKTANLKFLGNSMKRLRSN